VRRIPSRARQSLPTAANIGKAANVQASSSPRDNRAMILAAIDIGSNSVLLLVAAVEDNRALVPLKEAVSITRLAEGMSGDGLLAQPAIERTLEAVCQFHAQALSLGAQTVFAVGTAALREARNASELLEKLDERLNLRVQVLTAEQEAALSLAGVRTGPGLAHLPLLVLDVGGGSTELVASPAGTQAAFQASLPVGCVRQRVARAEPRSRPELTSLVEELQGTMEQAFAPARHFPGQLVGVGGTITSLAAIDLVLPEEAHWRVEGHRLTAKRIEEIALTVALTPLSQRPAIPGLPPGREDTLVAGAAIVLAAMGCLGRACLRVSRRGLRYGVLATAAAVP